MIIVPSNIGAPSTFTVTFQRGVFAPDLTTITGVTFSVLRRDGTTTSLTGKIASATPSTLIAQYTFVGGEITSTGIYYLAPSLALSGGAIPAETITMMVDTPYAVSPKLEETAWIGATATLSATPPPQITWTPVATAQSPYAATRITPFLALDARAGGISLTLWAANDGDEVTIGDTYAVVGISSGLSLVAANGQHVPSGSGTYAGTGSFTNTSAFPLRLKFSQSVNAWLYR